MPLDALPALSSDRLIRVTASMRMAREGREVDAHMPGTANPEDIDQN